MCGIAGFVSPRRQPRAVLEAMNASICHRGPDDAGVWVASPAARDGWTSAEGQIGLSQQRLAILDLSPAGRNPMPNDDETLWITYNGEVYNYLEVRRELESEGFRFRSQTDTEVILKAYERWGTDCLRRFIGMFAFAIWDSRRRVALRRARPARHQALLLSVERRRVRLRLRAQGAPLPPRVRRRDRPRRARPVPAVPVRAEPALHLPRRLEASAGPLPGGEKIEFNQILK